MNGRALRPLPFSKKSKSIERDLLLWPGAESFLEGRALEGIKVSESLPTRVKGACFLPATRTRAFLCVGSLKEVSEIPGGG
jgi:hypothetical protein